MFLITYNQYHGSMQAFNEPDLRKSKTKIDFGRGFYVTQHRYDALDILDRRSGYLYKYELDLDGLSILDFSELKKKDWQQTIISFRHLGNAQIAEGHDIIIGDTAANTKIVFKKLKTSPLTKELSALLEPKNRQPQIVLKTQKAISHLKLLEIEELDFE